MFNSILVVCVGNICRSPIGERILQKYCPQKIVTSAGLNAVINNPADKEAIFIAGRHELSLEGHVAKQLNRVDCVSSDLILVMENKHISAVSQICPEARGKIMLYGYWLNNTEIIDPYQKSRETFDYVYNLLERSARKWALTFDH
jgi:protein-tyrosine phosphatase